MELQPKTSFEIENSPCITSDEYFMGIAILLEKLSERNCYPVGACIVNSNQRIVGTGYNTIHKGWNNDEDMRSLFLCHAEAAAILNKTSTDVKGCTMYVTKFPCNDCAKRIISSDIKKIIYCDMKRNYMYTTKRIQAAKKIFAANGVTYEECTTIYNKLVPKVYYRFSRLTNEECFMGIALLISKQCENVERIGACIINKNNVIVGVEYNSLSRKMNQIENSLQQNIPASYFNVCYADFIINSILSISCDVEDCTIYVTTFPCNEIAEVIVQSGIKTVKYLCENIDDETKAAKEIFDAYSIKYRQFNGKISNIEIFKSYYRLECSIRSYQNKKQSFFTQKVKEEHKKTADEKKRRTRKKNRQIQIANNTHTHTHTLKMKVLQN
ncbi:uncharacterized protein LOC109860693 [Pseudomyrmex gracilis]|uniref:uncharacterized protein LOC109860693 n=1 Tax=Pseudomyrmex gracilis TaxID=219809 RepID=UPI000994AA49|nr:uncharacterized protein LOC109860693 [Pseudomyrmex gracilis]XP_020295562.1 uncharacterized protein LOC109860693 [Pseudomyrmex gracilis]